MRSSNSIYSNKKIIRDTYAQHAKELVGLDNRKISLEKIQSISFGEDAMIVVGKNQLIIYSIINMKVFFTKEGFFWDAAFIPCTALIALVEHDGTVKSRKTLKILSLEKNQIFATLTVTFQIQTIKASQHCICLAGIKELSVIHFPTLKPIFHELAGSGLNIIYDISFEALTLAHQNQKKGVIMVHNFSSISTTRARRKSYEHKRKSVFASISYQPREMPKKIVQIKAHKQYISLIRLSPNGNRVASASHKGTMIRIFLTENGKLWQELRIGYELCKLLDMNFYQQGNVLSCLNEKSMVYLFNTKLEPMEEQAESQKRGYKIYEQSNPKSMFSFLSIFYSNFGNQHPFAFFKLTRPIEAKEEKDENKNTMSLKQQSSPLHQKQQKYMQVILEQIENPSKSEVQILESNQEKTEKLESATGEHQLDQINEKMQRSSSAMSETKVKKSKSLLKKLNVIQAKKDNHNFKPKIYNTFSRVFIGGNNFVWVAKGPYIFSLKYDPFNGGEMYFKQTLKFC